MGFYSEVAQLNRHDTQTTQRKTRKPTSLLSFDKPAKLRPTTEHNALHQSDSGVAGTYVPNMSMDDSLKWRAKRITGKDPRVEIRKTLKGSQMLLVVRPHEVTMSTNGRLSFSWVEFDQLEKAVSEARWKLAKHKTA